MLLRSHSPRFYRLTSHVRATQSRLPHSRYVLRLPREQRVDHDRGSVNELIEARSLDPRLLDDIQHFGLEIWRCQIDLGHTDRAM